MDASISVEAAVDRLCQLTGAPARNQGDEIVTGCPLCRNDTHHLYVKAGVSQSLLIRCVKNEDHGPAIIRQFFPPPAPTNGNGKHPAGALSRYEYHDGEGNLRFFVEVTRYPDGHKESRMGQPGPSGDQWHLRGVNRLLWHLPQIQRLPEGSLVLLPEGEKDVCALERAGFPATTNAGGTGGWNASLVEPLKPFRVAIPYDADLPGKRLAERKLVDLTSAGIDARLIDLGYPITAEHGKDISDWLREHSPAELAVKIQAAFQVPPGEPAAPPERFALRRLKEVGLVPAIEWQVEPLFEQGSLVVMFGPSGCGKTFLAGSLSLGQITGLSWFNYAMVAGPVCYVNADGGAGFARRVLAWMAEMGEDHPHEFLTLNEPVNLFQTSEVIEFATVLKALPESQRPRLIVFDTLARCMAGGDENSTGDMGIVVRNVNYLQRELAATCLLVHHTGWVGDRMRGNSSLHSAADTVISVAAAEGRHRVRCDKQRNGEPFAPFEFRLEPVGESCVVRLLAPMELTHAGASRPQRERGSRLGRLTAIVAAAEARVRQTRDEGCRASMALLEAEFPDIAPSTLWDDVSQLVSDNQISRWNRPVPGIPRRVVFGIHQRCEADCEQNPGAGL